MTDETNTIHSIPTESEVTRTWSHRGDPVVSIVCTTYNHQYYIEDALHGFVTQVTDFPFEIIIRDDASTDGTTEIVKKYAELFPNIIRAFIEEENGWVKGIAPMRTARSFAKGKYLALCEGDDYWINTMKLQKQVDFLLANSNFSLCFHNVNVVHEGFPEKNRLNNNSNFPEVTTLDDLLKGENYIATASVVIRTELTKELPHLFNTLPFGDYPLYLLASRFGKIRYINEVMATYRIHPGGVHGYLTNSPYALVKAYELHYKFWNIIKASGVFETYKLKRAIVLSLENIIRSAARSKQSKIFIKYNLILLKTAGAKEWRKVVKQILRYFSGIEL